LPTIRVITSEPFAFELGVEKRRELGSKRRTALSGATGEPEGKIAVFWTPYADALDPLPVKLHIDYEGSHASAFDARDCLCKASSEAVELLEAGTQMGSGLYGVQSPFGLVELGEEYVSPGRELRPWVLLLDTEESGGG
jgi:hypothetical protein